MRQRWHAGRHVLAVSVLAALAGGPAPAGARRPVTLDDLVRIRDVAAPQVSPDGAWVAYTVTTLDAEHDKRDTDVWMVSWDGARNLRATTSRSPERAPRWSPDGRYLAFLSSREDPDEADQLWLLPRAGGEAERVTGYEGGVVDYAWAPDGRRLVLVVEDTDPRKAAAESSQAKTPPPIVVERFQFKKDRAGYLGERRQHLYLFDLDKREGVCLTPGDHDEAMPAWSPDGRWIAFVSKRAPDPDRSEDWNVFAIEPRPGSEPRRLTAFPGADNDPEWESPLAWSPDSRHVAYLQGGPQELLYYAVHKLAVVPVAGGAERLPAPHLDRNVSQPQWSADGESLLFLLEEDQAQQVARVPAAGGRLERLTQARHHASALAAGARGRLAVLAGTPAAPHEVHALEGGALRPLSRQNDAWLAEVALGTTREIEFTSRDGTRIRGLVLMPAGWDGTARLPAILQIHGGPVSQFANRFYFLWQLLAAHGYAVVGANPRGSSGRGEAFQKAIYADWGALDAEDVLAAVDHAVAAGIADPERLGVGGWSYGGMLTNYVIARDTRFRAATSGAAISNVLAGYGTDQYIREYEAEMGPPWRDTAAWLRISYPFLHADRIVTPTLFLCGDKDFNVPLLGSEQMYQALRSLGVQTQLVIYPGEHHSIRKPSYQRDRLQRYLAWYDRFLRGQAAARSSR